MTNFSGTIGNRTRDYHFMKYQPWRTPQRTFRLFSGTETGHEACSHASWMMMMMNLGLSVSVSLDQCLSNSHCSELRHTLYVVAVESAAKYPPPPLLVPVNVQLSLCRP
jgi:hypothetical protein